MDGFVTLLSQELRTAPDLRVSGLHQVLHGLLKPAPVRCHAGQERFPEETEDGVRGRFISCQRRKRESAHQYDESRLSPIEKAACFANNPSCDWVITSVSDHYNREARKTGRTCAGAGGGGITATPAATAPDPSVSVEAGGEQTTRMHDWKKRQMKAAVEFVSLEAASQAR